VSELDVYAHELSWIFKELERCLDGLTEAELASRPIESGNSPFTIVNHVVETTRVYVVGFGCGLPASRDRKAEFEAVPTSIGDLARRLDDLDREVTVELARLPAERLNERLLPVRELWGTGPIREISRREGIIEGLRHAALHLGELRLTRDLVKT
jgi:hypothetical protein